MSWNTGTPIWKWIVGRRVLSQQSWDLVTLLPIKQQLWDPQQSTRSVMHAGEPPRPYPAWGLECVLVSPTSFTPCRYETTTILLDGGLTIAIHGPYLLARCASRGRVTTIRSEALPCSRGSQLCIIRLTGINFRFRGVIERLPILGAGGCGGRGRGCRDLPAVGGRNVLRTLLLVGLVLLGRVLLRPQG